MRSDTLSQENKNNDDEIDLKELFSVLWKDRLLIIIVSSLFAIFSVFYSLSLTDYYKSEAVLSVTGESNIGGSLSGFGELASLAGINMPSSGEDKSIIAIKTIQSRAFLRHLITFKNVLPSIMATKSYDFKLKKIEFDPKIYNEEYETWVRQPGKNQQLKPSYLEAYKAYLDQVSVNKDDTSNLITLSVEHISPKFAKEFSELIIMEVNELLRNRDLQESSAAISFLNNEIPKSSLITMRDAISKLVQAQLEKQMLSKVNKEYILKVIEPPFIAEEKSKPSRALICIIVTLLGGLITIIWILMRYYFLGNSNTNIRV